MRKQAPPHRVMRLRKQAPHKPIQRLASRHRAGVKTHRIEEAGCREFLAVLPPNPPLPARQTLRGGHPQNRSLADAGIRTRVRKTFSASLGRYSGGLTGRRDQTGIWMTMLRQEEQEADFPRAVTSSAPFPGIQISSLFSHFFKAGHQIGDPKYGFIFEGKKISASISTSLRYAKVRAAFLGAIVLLCAGCAAHSPGNASGWTWSEDSGRTKAVTSGQELPQSENSGPAAGQPAPDQAAASASGLYPGQARRWCAPPIPENEGLLHKIIRILSGPDWCGPDPDVDTNISAGGAAGG
jgi:hypothetical protein